MRLWKRKDDAGKRRRKIRKLRLLTLLLVLGVLGFGAFVFGVVTAIAEEIPKLDPAYQQRISKNGFIYSSDGKRVLAVLRGAESRVIVPSDEITPVMKQAIVAIEDRRFFEHRGVDLHAIFRAVWADITSGNVVQGGSTITQQFIKNAYVHSAPSISRKLKEAALAWQLEQRWSKDRILTAYLNTIYFGNGAYGIQQAARIYFDKSARDLDLATTRSRIQPRPPPAVGKSCAPCTSRATSPLRSCTRRRARPSPPPAPCACRELRARRSTATTTSSNSSSTAVARARSSAAGYG